MFREAHDYFLLGVAVPFAAIASYEVIRQVRRETEREAETRLRLLSESIPAIVWTASPGRGIEYCNRRWCDLTGMTVEQSLGFGWMDARHPEDRGLATMNWERGRKTSVHLDAKYRFRTAAGAYRW